ncbi:DgyrCDS6005 [Dimorphilus gyrociliatus]|uniref:DgyrCDS6005 n=1 Tax=Dimorphilus gyrociliatus TaxID=2664684 RepID=A0A7I8VP20_9ANNE|nr:DgyrCDS6005 [Dimorphilus gyrociliatus]
MADEFQEDLLRDKIITGESALSLTAEGLHDLFNCFKKYCDQDICSSFEVLYLNQLEPPQLIQDIQFLFDFVQKVKHLKVFHKPQSTLQGDLQLSCFPILENIELRQVPLHLLRGLHKLRPRLKKLVIQKSISNVEDVLWYCGAERAESKLWPKLTVLSLHHNYLERLDDSFELLPEIIHLDLSHNFLTSTDNYLSSLSKLETLHIGYNDLRIIPFLSSELRITLTTLSLRYNCLEDIEGIDILVNLQVLDCSYNLLSKHFVLKDLINLKHLKKLSLRGNPLCYEKNHRLIVCTFINPTICKELELDERRITRKEFEKSTSLPRISFESTRFLQSLPRPSISESFNNSSDLIYSRKLRRKKRKPNIEDESSVTCDQGMTSEFEQKSNLQQGAQSFQDEILSLRSQMGENWLQAVNDKLLTDSKEPPEQRETVDIEESSEFADEVENKQNELENCNLITKTSTPINVEMLPPFHLSNPVGNNNLDEKSNESWNSKLVMNDQPKVLHSTEDSNPLSIGSSEPDVDFYINSSDSDSDQTPKENLMSPDDGVQFIVKSFEESIIIEIKDNFLIERDITGKIRTKLDLTALKDISNNNAGSNHIRVEFVLLKKENQERNYIFDNYNEMQDFFDNLRSFLKNPQEKAEKFECLKCGGSWIRTDEKELETCPRCNSHTIIANNTSCKVNVLAPKIQDTESAPKTDDLSTSKKSGPSFNFLDNLLNLHVSLNLLDEEDTVRLLLECQYRKHKGKRKHQCLLVFSQKYLFVLHLVNTDRNSKSVPWKKVAVKADLQTLSFLERGPFCQYLRIEFQNKTDIAPTTFFFPDEDTGKAFIEKLNINFTELLDNPNVSLHVEKCRPETQEALQRLFQSEASISLPDILYYTFSIWYLSETVRLDISLILSDEDIALVDENFEYWFVE